MSASDNQRTGGRILIDQLVVHGVDTVFCVPGESYLAALDAFHDVPDRIRLITCRHEAAAANMAEAYGKMTGKPGICFVTRAPGACHASIGLHTAYQDSTPLVLFIGQIARDMEEREAFQEMDYRRFLDQATKWTAEIHEPHRIPELVSQAFHRATSGRPGPVALSLPEDMLVERSGVGDAKAYNRIEAHPGPADMAQLRDMLMGAKRPILLLGGGGWSAHGVQAITRFVENFNLPATAAFRNQDRFDNRHANYAGDVGIGASAELLQRVKEADLFMIVGPRLGEQTSQGYKLIGIPEPDMPVVHVHPGAEELGRVFRPALAINAGMTAFAEAAAALEAPQSVPWGEWTAEARRDYLAYSEIQPTSGALDMAHVMAVLREKLVDDVVVANDAGNFSGWAQRYLAFTRYPSQVGPTSGAMGYGVPATIGAAIAAPERQVVGFVGDGGFLMSGTEIATAIHHGIKALLFVVNNNMYGTIRMHQEREFPGRYPGTDLTNPDIAAFAQSFGAFGETVTADEDFAPALDRALASEKFAVLELVTDPEAISSKTTLSAIRDAALARQNS